MQTFGVGHGNSDIYDLLGKQQRDDRATLLAGDIGIAVTPFLHSIKSDNEVTNVDVESIMLSQGSHVASAINQPMLKPKFPLSRRQLNNARQSANKLEVKDEIQETARETKEEVIPNESEALNGLETPGNCKETLLDANEQIEQPSMHFEYAQRQPKIIID